MKTFLLLNYVSGRQGCRVLACLAIPLMPQALGLRHQSGSLANCPEPPSTVRTPKFWNFFQSAQKIPKTSIITKVKFLITNIDLFSQFYDVVVAKSQLDGWRVNPSKADAESHHMIQMARATTPHSLSVGQLPKKLDSKVTSINLPRRANSLQELNDSLRYLIDQ